MYLKTVLATSRPSFLILAPICVFLGLSTSLTIETSVNYHLFYTILAGTILAHISVNTLNEYFDFKSGLDFKTLKTPFSGGSGSLPENPSMASIVLLVGVTSLLSTIAIGIYLTIQSTIDILFIGIAGVFLIVTYTQWLNRNPVLCLIAPGLGFGLLVVVGTQVVLTGQHSPFNWLVSLVPFFMMNNLLLINQYPDISADASIGRKTLPISFGLNTSNLVYALFSLSAYTLIGYLLITGQVPAPGIIALSPAGLSAYALYGAIKYTSDIATAPRFMAANVAASLLTPLLLALSIVYA